MAEKTSFKQDQIRAMRERNAREAEERQKAERAAEKKAAIPALREKMASIPVKKPIKGKKRG